MKPTMTLIKMMINNSISLKKKKMMESRISMTKKKRESNSKTTIYLNVQIWFLTQNKKTLKKNHQEK